MRAKNKAKTPADWTPEQGDRYLAADSLEDAIRHAERIDITKLDQGLLKDVELFANYRSKGAGDLEEYIARIGIDKFGKILQISAILRAAEKGNPLLTENELWDALERFLCDAILELMVRDGKIKRTKEWTYKNRGTCMCVPAEKLTKIKSPFDIAYPSGKSEQEAS